MIEIIFGDSALGSLKMAQHAGKGAFQQQIIGISVFPVGDEQPTEEELETARREAQERAEREWARSAPLGGDVADVYGFCHGLSIGDISENTPGPRRQQVLEWLFSVYPETGEESFVPTLLQKDRDTLHSIRSRVQDGEALRIWCGNIPDEQCGLYWFLARMAEWQSSPALSIIQLPGWEADEQGGILSHISWGEVSPGDFHRYLPLEKPVPPAFVQSCAAYWTTLQAENAPLRAVINGQLASAPETLYDDFIRREIAAEEEVFHEAAVIGRVLGKYSLGIGDAWVAHRIEHMIQQGLLVPVSEAPKDVPRYHRKLKKCGDIQPATQLNLM